MIDKKYQWLVIFIFGLAIFGGIYYATLGFIRRDMGEVVIDALPTYATITIDGKKSGQGSKFLSEGSHKIEVSASGFDSTSQTIVVKKAEKQTFLASLLSANSEGEKWVQDHAELYKKFEEKGAINAQEKGAKAQKEFPIVSLLPYEDDTYIVGYRMPKEDELVITIRGTSSLARQLALSRIKSWGYDPAEFSIEFVDYRSPFVTQEEEDDHHD